MNDPVLFAEHNTGTSYDRDYAERLIGADLARFGEVRDPLTREPILNYELIPNRALRQAIDDYKVERDAWERRTRRQG
eukprot:COSAG06_NODE_4318_length_4368_cov_2.106114_3_plen_78_part_00